MEVEDFGKLETAWCPGCGNFAILQTLKKALAEKNIAPHQILFVSGIGQAAKTPHYMKCNLFNGLHGRSLPVATGARLTNPELPVIVESGDGCNYAEGGNHFLAALRRNVNVTFLVHDNQIYGLTKGQASPTSQEGHVTKAQPQGSSSMGFKPLTVALALGAGFVARGFTGMQELLKKTIQEALDHPGFALVDILQQCVSFNRLNTFQWYKKRCYELDEAHDVSSWQAALAKSQEWGDRIPVGILYKNTERDPFESHFPFLEKHPPAKHEVDMEAVSKAMWEYS